MHLFGVTFSYFFNFNNKIWVIAYHYYQLPAFSSLHGVTLPYNHFSDSEKSGI